ncbi:hypothetical protein ACHQM5_012109 [Ranunculus cassubicifolius]
MRSDRDEQIHYTPIKHAIQSLNQRVNLIGVILDYSLPAHSRGTDCYCIMKIIDESYQAHGLPVNVFLPTIDRLPHVKLAGDIACFHQVMIKKWNGKIYACYDKLKSKFGIFEGKSGTRCFPYSASSGSVVDCIGDSEKVLINSLRKWLLNHQLDSGVNESFVPLKEISLGKEIDLVCKVVRIQEVSQEEVILYLWDGTDTPPLSFRKRFSSEMDDPVPLQLEASVLPRDVLCGLPTVGTIMRTPFVGKDNAELARRIPCRWVKFFCIKCEESSGMWHGVFGPKTKHRIISDEDNLATSREREYEKRISTKFDRMPMSAFPCPCDITKTDHPDVALTTLMDVLTSLHVTAIFKCVVRVISMCPWRVEDFISPDPDPKKRVYRIQVTLEDPTARIHAIIYNEDGEKFFGGYPSMDVLCARCKKLVGVGGEEIDMDTDSPRNPPWIQVCLKSYYIDVNDRWGSRMYRIFDTMLVDT